MLGDQLEMGTLYLTTPDVTLHKLDERLQVRKKQELLLDLPLIKVAQVVAFGRVTITSAAIEELTKRKIGVCYLTFSGRYVAHIESGLNKNILLRTAQYKTAFEPSPSLEIARQFIHGKLANMRVALRRLHRERPNEKLEKALNSIKRAEKSLQRAGDLNSVRGYEGAASAAYFSVFSHFLKVKDFTFSQRLRRPPPDPVNALLSLGYTLLGHDLQTACHLVGFDPYLGFLHTDRYGRPSLALDLMEEFRPLIVDTAVLRCINLRMITPADFQESLGGSVQLTENGLKTFLKAYQERKNTMLKHPALDIKVSYQRCFELQARILARHLSNEMPKYIPLVVQ